jgi:hypothetical protein
MYMHSISVPDNILAALEQSNRVCQVFLEDLAGPQLEEVLAAMQVPFPELTQMKLSISEDETVETTASVIPDSFLGGSAPRLRSFILNGVPFPGLPKLLLTATHLVELSLLFVPNSGYILPGAMAALISVLSNLETLRLKYTELRYHESRPVTETRSLSPPKRSILPALRRLSFRGGTKYFEELIAHIGAPQLDSMDVDLSSQITTPRLAHFINSTSLKAGDKAIVEFQDGSVTVKLTARVWNLRILICFRERNQRLSSVAHVFNPLHSLSTVEDLCIGYQSLQLVWLDDAIENTLWLQLLLLFTAVKNLYISKKIAPSIVAALQGLVGSRITEVLPSLQNIFVEKLEPSGHLQENLEQFVAARQLPIAISDWDRKRM